MILCRGLDDFMPRLYAEAMGNRCAIFFARVKATCLPWASQSARAASKAGVPERIFSVEDMDKGGAARDNRFNDEMITNYEMLR